MAVADGKGLLSGELLHQVEEAARANGIGEEDVEGLVSVVRSENQARR